MVKRSLGVQLSLRTLLAVIATCAAVAAPAWGAQGGGGPCGLECPPAQMISLDEFCQALMPDLAAITTADCGPGETLVTQNIPAGLPVFGPQTFDLTITAESSVGGISDSCVVPVTFVDDLPPAITLQPIGDAICEGGLFAFSGEGSDGCGAVTYQWTKDGEDIFGATEADYVIALTDPLDTGLYAVRISDASGNSATSVETALVVGAAFEASITADPPALPCPGAPATLTATTTGGGASFAYSWSTGETTESIVVTQAGTYSVTVTGEGTCESVDAVEITAGLDATEPDVTCPADLAIACDDPTDPEFTGMGSAIDDCDPDPDLSFDDEIIAGACMDTYTINRTWTAMDGSGNSSMCVQTITVADDMPPTITAGEIAACYPSEGEAESAAISATMASDDCSLVKLIATTDVVGCDATITVTATDACGNSADVEYVTQVLTAPPVVATPDDIATIADAGGCDALIVVPPLDVTSDCPLTSITNDFTGTADASGVYPSGDTVVTWTVTDACGGEQQVTQIIAVAAENAFLVSMALQLGEPEVSRCITFEFYECPGAEPAVARKVVTFTDGVAADIPLTVPCGGYTCVTARDSLHSLRRTDDDQFGLTPIIDNQYVADFTDNSESGGDDDTLIGGNLNDNDFIEVLDFALFVIRFGQTLGQSDCETPGPHPDPSGDGRVFSEDFSFIQINFLDAADPVCCAASGLAEREAKNGDGPRLAISVDELRELGLGHLATSDLNGDAWVDLLDLDAFAAGVHPPPRTYTIVDAGVWSAPTTWAGDVVPDASLDAEVHGAIVLDAPGAAAREIFVLEGAVLAVADGGLVADRIEVAAGGTLRVLGDDAFLSVGALHLEPGAALEWDGGVIEIVGGALEPALLELAIAGADARSALRLVGGATALVAGDTLVGRDPGQDGELEVAGSMFATGRSLFVGVGGNGRLDVTGASLVSAADGVYVGRTGLVTGSGIIEGGVRNLGRVAPRGALTVVGPYDQGEIGAESIHVSGASALTLVVGPDHHDRLVVDGLAMLGGRLEVTLADGYVPRAGASFELVRAGLVEDRFDVLDLPALPPGLAWVVDYAPDAVSATVVRLAGPGDLRP